MLAPHVEPTAEGRLKAYRIDENTRLLARSLLPIVRKVIETETRTSIRDAIEHAPVLGALLDPVTEEIVSQERRHFSLLFAAEFGADYFQSQREASRRMFRIGLGGRARLLISARLSEVLGAEIAARRPFRPKLVAADLSCLSRLLMADMGFLITLEQAQSREQIRTRHN